ncbi:MAG TPA: twin-arginine translocation signal domain-containing protein, partial [Thermoanaerobaculia bacterium]|nr:twin-arginine translocation signal domain-containing protein [Thermoanaerobaculia bacterium]
MPSEIARSTSRPSARAPLPGRKVPRAGLDRRSFLGRLSVGAASVVGLTAAVSKADSPPPGKNVGEVLDPGGARRGQAFDVRMEA